MWLVLINSGVGTAVGIGEKRVEVFEVNSLDGPSVCLTCSRCTLLARRIIA